MRPRGLTHNWRLLSQEPPFLFSYLYFQDRNCGFPQLPRPNAFKNWES